MRTLLVICCSFFLVGCFEEKEIKDEFFFDMDSFIKAEIEILNNRSGLCKISCLNDKCDTTISDTINWIDLFAAFRSADINSPVNKEDYNLVDSRNESGSGAKTYTSINESQDVSLMEIKFKENQPFALSIYLDKENPLSSKKQEMHYSRDFSFQIIGELGVPTKEVAKYSTIVNLKN